jgi:hypothetical protein
MKHDVILEMNPVISHQGCRRRSCVIILDLPVHWPVRRRIIVGWSDLYVSTVYDRMFGDFPAKANVYTLYIHGTG